MLTRINLRPAPRFVIARSLITRLSAVTLAILTGVSLIACSQTAVTHSPAPAPEATKAAEVSAPPHTAMEAAPPGAQNQLQIARLRDQRSADAFSNVLAIGPGDLIVVTVPEVPELNKFKVRVSEDNTVTLPLAGVMQVGGMTEDGLRRALYQRLQKPVKNPDVQIFVEQYHSRDVAVVGMVQKPGLYSITTRTDTILDMINQAGGMTADASSRVLFIAAAPGSNSRNMRRMELTRALAAREDQTPPAAETKADTELSRDSAATADDVAAKPLRVASRSTTAAAGTGAGQNEAQLLSMLGANDPIEIDVTASARTGALDLNVRPGDTIIVPASGEVMVDGWVQNPGAFRIVPGMTALSAVSAAGGALFSQSAQVLRANPDGSRVAMPLDLASVKSGAEHDISVQAGDVVWVNHTMSGAIPYGLYEIFQKFGTGMFFPAP